MNDAPRIDILRDLLKVPTRVWEDITAGERWDLLQLLDWMQLDPKSTTPVAPYIDIKVSGGKHQRLYLPTAAFNNVTGLEYTLIDDLYSEFIKTQDADVECRMIAFTLRPGVGYAAGLDDGMELPLIQRIKLTSPAQITAWLPLITLLPLSIRTYMTMLISANRADFHDRYGPWLFEQQSTNADDGLDAEADEAGYDIGWHGAFMDIAADGVFGTYDDVCHTAHHTICIYMCRKVQEARDRQREYDHQQARMEA